MSHNVSAQISGVVIELAISQRRFSIEDIRSRLPIQAERGTITPVLSQLSDDGWIEEVESPLESWKTGPLARRYGDMGRYRQEDMGIIPVLPGERER